VVGEGTERTALRIAKNLGGDSTARNGGDLRKSWVSKPPRTYCDLISAAMGRSKEAGVKRDLEKLDAAGAASSRA